MARTINYNDGYRTLTNLTLYGLDGLRIRNPGELMTDLYGLDTVTTVWEAPSDLPQASWPVLFSAHPLFPWTAMERRRVQIGEGVMTITADYAGVNGQTAHIFEACLGVGDETIESHPKFVSTIGGKPSAPLNGAIFLDPDGNITTDDSLGRFAYFSHMIGGSVNPFIGIESYLAADQYTIREKYVLEGSITLGPVGFIDSPPFNPGSAVNFIKISCNIERRGLCFFVTNEWRAGGRRGWNPTIYTP